MGGFVLSQERGPGSGRVAEISGEGLKEADIPQAKIQQNRRAEEIVMSYILANGFTSREEIVQKFRSQGVEIGVRSVSRYLKTITEKGLLPRDGKKYVVTDLGRNRERQDTL